MIEPMTAEQYEFALHEYGAGFDATMIRELCRVLTPIQIDTFRFYLDEAEQLYIMPN